MEGVARPKLQFFSHWIRISISIDLKDGAGPLVWVAVKRV